jgi:hypothetical protein
MPNISNAEILESAYKLRDALNPYIHILSALLEEQGMSEQDRNVLMYKLTDKLSAASEGFPPGIITITLAFTLNKFLEHVIHNSTPA